MRSNAHRPEHPAQDVNRQMVKESVAAVVQRFPSLSPYDGTLISTPITVTQEHIDEDGVITTLMPLFTQIGRTEESVTGE